MLRHAQSHVSPVCDTKAVQPNAIDLRIDQLFVFRNHYNDVCTITEVDGVETKKQRELVELPPQYLTGGGIGWMLGPGEYPFETTQSIVVPEGMAGWLIPRSTLNRNGIGITSGLYDSGYNNRIGGLLRVPAGLQFVVSRGARVAQFIMADAETVSMYAGEYNKKV